MFVNFAETHRDPAEFFAEQAYHRLRRIKTTVDPGDVTRAKHPVPADRWSGTSNV